MKISIISLLLGILAISVSAQNTKPAYLIFDSEGKEVNYNEMLQEALKADVVLFGELHNNPICHWLQYELVKDIHWEAGDNLIIGSEVFERDDQIILNEYLNGDIQERNFNNEIKLWDNYNTDYKPLVEFAKGNGLPFIATNIPRRYASMVHHNGLSVLDGISESAKDFIMPLPLEVNADTPGYDFLLEMGGGEDGGESFMQAQAVKDATMAYSILEHWKKGKLFFHFNGDFHSAEYGGIYWYLKKSKKKLKVMVISSVESMEMEIDDEIKKNGDYIIMVPQTMTKTY